mmetsp:Transcript_15709/g.21623  ORF Transcript_15709/g.21623 Transcript_15709/m.21623 type:complete len:399 (+) Transcript_15709:82-1278(+)|eukprot:CAMPEP_0194724248 /NCGR_PEP_ID=MMETSP0296-20130528/19189_1 /TAXON_ID=39354 /ORGANISM="Heterosigma akashiwo, Strain CCMP2393" /LENGTH=398 /DNA_ID=CAMNT_0039628141 /DNA_START=69 /DNA_END=1268 /DNA_ORIENTATION=-
MYSRLVLFIVLLLALAKPYQCFKSSPSGLVSSGLGVSKKMSGLVLNSDSIGAVGSKLTNKELAFEGLAKFVDDDPSTVDMVPTTGGVNNICQFVTLPNGEKYLLRIYNNGLDTTRVAFEHSVLQQLEGVEMSFKVPKFLPVKGQEGGSTFAELSNGAQACLVEVIPGGLPKLTCVRDIGRASGELNKQLGVVGANVDPATCNCAPYWDMYAVHHAVTEENLKATLQGAAFDGDLRPFADKALADVLDITAKCERYRETLPVQLIHGDLHYDNVLVQDGKVTGLLDFEFAAFDWRALELAICLSKYAGEPDAITYFDDFIEGYATTGVLTPEEARAVPELINLRILSNVVYFVGRAVAGEDDIASLTTRIQMYCERVDWVKANADRIANQVIEKMGLVV